MDDSVAVQRSEYSRTFICIDLPEEIKSSIYSMEQELPAGSVRLVSKENLHITLVFLGDIDSNKIDAVKRLIGSLNQKSFQCSVKGLGTFSMKRPNVLFSNVLEGRDAIKNIYDQLINPLGDIGIKTESRNFIPHVTMARTVNLKEKDNLIRILEENAERTFGEFLCDSIILKKSVLTGRGPMYTNLQVKLLE